MIRSRASQPGNEANDLMADYYAQRATAGLIVSEGAYISPLAKGYAWMPGVFTSTQIEGWRKVTTAVHQRDGRIFAQLWHAGRLSHTSLLNGEQPVSSSSDQAKGAKVYISSADCTDVPGFTQASAPRTLSKAEIAEVVTQYRDAARNARCAGFDGVELNADSGYLVNQFIDSNANNRTDEYGGSLRNRLRFLEEATQALIDGTGDAKRVGIRLPPLSMLNSCVEADPETGYLTVAKMLGAIGVAYIHIAEADWGDAPPMTVAFKHRIRQAFPGVLIYAGKYTPDRAREAIGTGWVDLVAFGRPFVAIADLPQHLRIRPGLASHALC